ncbi:MAG: phospho-sugar mutase [Oscillospiraceae bacterium]|nr:phospho-sugar mutase [Oscillospiraceae bacterium]
MVNELYSLWCKNAVEDTDLSAELKSIADSPHEINDRFYRDLEFGTGGLRGVIGAGTYRMNIYTVAKATQGLADYVNSVTSDGKVAIAYDSRNKSDLFARTAACVFAANGIKVYIYSELMPTPMLSFAVRRLKCDAGVVVTASHNPGKYNGYKAYGPDGCQLTLEASEKVLGFIKNVDTFNGVKKDNFDEALKSQKIEYIQNWLIEEYLDNVQKQSISPEVCVKSDFKVIYTPLYGTGNKPVRSILKRIGIKDVTVVTEQELPNGNFPTAPFPNPEIRQVFECALTLAVSVKPDLLLATDPDCDRVGIAVKSGDDFVLMTGNEVGALLLNYILSRRTELGTMPKNPIAVKTIVTTALCEKIAADYNCELINVLTGFKFIGEQIKLLEDKGEDDRYIFGFEESYGYLAGSYVRDKDAVVASMLICEMACYYKSLGKTLLDMIAELETKYGVYLNTQNSYTCEGQQGMLRMKEIMDDFRKDSPSEIGGYKVVSIFDYETSVSTNVVSGKTSKIDLPQSNVLEYRLENGSSVIIRPSGTEPKIKVYLSSIGKSKDDAKLISSKLEVSVKTLMGF